VPLPAASARCVRECSRFALQSRRVLTR
jgi:hypothetical protein